MPEPIGVILAGGRGRRIGGAKATVQLRGRPLISYPLAALSAALEDVAVLVKPDTQLPSLPGVTVWVEPDVPRHPLLGIVRALGMAEGRAVLVCALDLPFVTPPLVRRLVDACAGGAAAALACAAGEAQPLLGCYLPQATAPLAEAMRRGEPAREAAAALAPTLVEVSDPQELFNVNAPEDLLHAAALLGEDQPNVKS